MKTLFYLAFGLLINISVYAQENPRSHNVRGYTKKNGTYVAPHEQTNPNRTRKDNYSHKGNYNPYTGKKGRKN